MKCLKCNFEFSDATADFNYCPRCGWDLPEMSPVRVRVQKAEFKAIGIVMIGLVTLGAGIALWFIAPDWAYFTERNSLRFISIGLMIGGPLLIVPAIFIMVRAERIAKRLERESSDGSVRTQCRVE